MNIIVIDDQINVVKGVLVGVNWERLRVDQVYEAYNIIEAKERFRENQIDVMVCDIEMPMGNGIELLQWVREHSPKTECIFLTSHEEFEYAKAAIKLGSFDYLLQPIKYDDLEKVIAKAIEKIEAAAEVKTFYTYGTLWHNNQENILEKFWFDLLKGVYKNDLTKIIKAAKRFNLMINGEEKYLPVLVSIMRREVLLSEWDDELLKYALNNILTEVMGKEEGELQFIQMDSSHMVMLIPEKSGLDENQLIQKCQFFLSACFRDLKCSLSCYIGAYCNVTSLLDMLCRLADMDRENVANYNKVFVLNEHQKELECQIDFPDLKRWAMFLSQGHNDRVILELTEFIDKLLIEERLDSATLFKFHQEFIQMYYTVLESKEIKAHDLFKEKDISAMYLKSLNSVYDLMAFFKHILSFQLDQDHIEKYYKSAVDDIMEYINENLEKELTRNELAERVFLNPEYLSRLFKKQTGVSLTEYITNEKIKVAKQYLVKSDLCVSIIASKVGYLNFSHFSQVFKKITGVPPNEYRQNNRK